MQATFRKMRAQQRTEQATRYEEFVRERMHGAGSWITTGRQVSPPADEGDAEAYSTKDEREVLTEQRGKEKILLAASAAQGRKTTSGMAPWKLAPLEAKAKDDKVSQKLMEQMMEDMRELKIEMADMKKILRYISSKL